MDLEGWSDMQILTVAARAVQQHTTTHLKRLGIPHLGLYVLEYLAERSPLFQSELAHLVLVRTPTITAVLVRLEREHLITRQHGVHRNQVAVAITDQGRKVLTAAQDHLRALQPCIDVEDLRPILLSIIKRTAH